MSSTKEVEAARDGKQADPESAAFLNKAMQKGSLEKVATKTPFPPCRYILVVMGFFAICNLYTLRVNISVAIVDMVNATYQRELDAAKRLSFVDNSTNTSSLIDVNSCAPVHDANKTAAKDGPFSWDSSQQLLVTGAYFYGYITTQILGGIVSQRFGGKLVLLIGIGVTSLLTIISPVCTLSGGYPAIVILRVLEGVFSGISFPSMSALLSNWAPPLERTLMSSFVFAGAQIGTVIGMSLTGILGWEAAFYFFGGLGLAWAILWFFLVYNSPSLHPRISSAEKEHIETSIGKKEKKSMHVPWLALLKSPPFYAIAAAHFTCLWGYYTLLNTLPLYFKNIMFFDIKQNGALSGAPYIVMWGAMLLSGFIADKVRAKNLLSTTNVRKISFSFGFIIPGACLVATGFVDCHNSAIAVALIIAAVACSAPAFGAWNVNHLDLAPAYAGTLMGITNTLGTIPGFLGTVVVSAFTNGNQTVEAWRNVFYVTAAIYAFGTVVYCVFGSGELQPWGIPRKEVEGKDQTKPSKLEDVDVEKV